MNLEADTTTATETTDTTVADATLLTETVEGGKEGAEGDGTLLTDGDKAKEEGKGSDEGKEAKEAKEAGAPEEYADFAKPEGVVLDDALVGDFKGLAKELNLPQDAAQKVVDLAIKMRQADAEAIVAVRQSWLDASKADAEFGGDNLGVNLATAKRGIEAYGSPALSQLLNETGLGNHPEFVRLFMKVGKTVSEDTHVSGGKAPPGNRSLAERLYPTSKE